MALVINTENHKDYLNNLTVNNLNKKFRLGKKEDAITAYISREKETFRERVKKITVRIVHLFKLRLITDKKCEKAINKEFKDLSNSLHSYYSDQISTVEGAKLCEASIRTGLQKVQTIVNLFKNTKINKSAEDELNLQKWNDLVRDLNAKLNIQEKDNPRHSSGSDSNDPDFEGKGTTNPDPKSGTDGTSPSSTTDELPTPDPVNPDQKPDTTGAIPQDGVVLTPDPANPGVTVLTPEHGTTHAEKTKKKKKSKKPKSDDSAEVKVRVPPPKNEFIPISKDVIKQVTDQMLTKFKDDLDDDYNDIDDECVITTSEGDFNCTFTKNGEGQTLIIEREDGVSYYQHIAHHGGTLTIKHLKDGLDDEGYDVNGYARDGFNRSNVNKQGFDYQGKKVIVTQARSQTLEEIEKENKLIEDIFEVINNSKTKFPHVIIRLLADAKQDPVQVYEFLRNKKEYFNFVNEGNAVGGIFHNAGIKVPFQKFKQKKVEKVKANPNDLTPEQEAGKNKIRIPHAFGKKVKASLGMTTLRPPKPEND